ncbi:MAG TPA: DUF881 domain-containing protein [Bacillota bacterium]|nr:DUF881 domain-containing protein [Bacillota bacterium]
MKSIKRVPWIITVISIIVGFMLAIQFRSTSKNAAMDSKDISQIRQDLQKEMEQHQRILSDISKYDQLLYQYENPLNQSDSLQVMKDELKTIKERGGLEEMNGAGMVIMITDVKNAGNVGTSASFSSIFDDDLRYIVNELFGAGAQAISINNNRITPTSAIRNVGDHIQMDTRIITLPFEIKVVGDPNVLESAMKLRGFEEYFKIINKKISLKKMDKVTVPAYQGKPVIRYMKPVKEGS